MGEFLEGLHALLSPRTAKARPRTSPSCAADTIARDLRAYLEGLEPRQRDVLRILGGLLFTAGALALFVRKANHSQWGDFGRLLVLLVPCAVLFLLGLRAAAERPATAQSVLLVLAVILVPLTLFQFLALVNGNANDSLNAAWIFGNACSM